MWNEEEGMYFDYSTVKQGQTTYESATTFLAMWAGVASPRQAAALVIKALPSSNCSVVWYPEQKNRAPSVLTGRADSGIILS